MYTEENNGISMLPHSRPSWLDSIQAVHKVNNNYSKISETIFLPMMNLITPAFDASIPPSRSGSLLGR
jgi:hypothetical protein